MDEESITEDLYRCFNLIRSTVEGVIPYNNSLNVWNVPGGLKRVKKAAFSILINGLRVPQQLNSEIPDDSVQVMLTLVSSTVTVFCFT